MACFGVLHVRQGQSAPAAPALTPYPPTPSLPLGAAVTLECPGLTGCGLSPHTLTTPSCHWGTRSAPAPIHYRTTCLCHRPKPPVTLNMGVVEAIDPSPSSCPSPVPGGYRLPRSSSYSPLQGRAGAELDLGAAAGGVLEGGGTAAERRTPLVDLFCETCSRPWLIGWWDQVGLTVRKQGLPLATSVHTEFLNTIIYTYACYNNLDICYLYVCASYFTQRYLCLFVCVFVWNVDWGESLKMLKGNLNKVNTFG